MEGFVTIVMCALEINSPLDCLIYGQVYIKNISGGSMRCVTEMKAHHTGTKQIWFQILAHGTCGTLFTMFNLLGFQFSAYKMGGG